MSFQLVALVVEPVLVFGGWVFEESVVVPAVIDKVLLELIVFALILDAGGRFGV